MKAIVLRKSGGPEILKPMEVEETIPGRREVRVKTHFVGINYADILSRKGLYGWAVKRPYILGMEGSGVIEAVGEGVDPARMGQKVMVGVQYGTYAERIVVPEERAIPVMEQFSMEESAAFLVNYMTAWVALFPLAKLQPKDKVLITAAAGGVGTAAVQLAAKLGCKVYGMSGSREKVDLIKSLGATDGFNYREAECFEKLKAATGGVDVVLEMVGGDIFRRSFDLLNPFGRMVVAGFASLVDLKKWNPISWLKIWKDIPRVKLSRVARKSVAVMATHIGHLLDEEPELLMRIYKDLKSFVNEHDIRPVISRVFPFEEARAAHQFIESRKSTGKVLLRLD
ncbi:MAG TPA: NADPH:quinone oxidoreductase family protein [Thermodesulfobacteriota bacterium]|nr:NADPH:quinone oxidoreductase family protein [Thermodesulfobacteriota bacterium]